MTRRPGRQLWLAVGLAALMLVASLGAIAALSGISGQSRQPTTAASGPAAGSTPLASPPPTPTKPPVPNRDTVYVQDGPPAGSPRRRVPATTVTVGGHALGTRLPESLMGISFDMDMLVSPLLDPSGSDFAETLRQLGGSPVLRFGGNSADRRFFWTSKGEAAPTWHLPEGSDVVRVTPSDLQRLKRLASATHARIILTVDLGHRDAARAADFAANAKTILGSSLIGLSIGNEPNGFDVPGDYLKIRPSGYSFQAYAREVLPMAQAVAKAAPGIRIIGPDVFDLTWVRGFAALRIPDAGAIAFHHYPLSNCSGKLGLPGTPSVVNVTSPGQVQHNLDYNRNMVAAARSAGLPLWLTESGISSCPGPNPTTRKHVSALWAVNYALGAASVGTTQMDIHSALAPCTGRYFLSPVCVKDDGAVTPVTRMQPEYYGMMLVDNLAPGTFQQVTTLGGGNVYAYAIKQSAKKTTVVLVSQNDPSTAAQSSVTINLPAKARTGTMSQLTGPSFAAEGETRIDGMESPGWESGDRARIPGFKPGSARLVLPITAGTATVLEFGF